MEDRGCNLECIKNKDLEGDVREFVGPVKIVLIDVPRSAYVCKTCYAAAIVLAQMMMAVVTLIVIIYSMSFKKRDMFKALHIFLGTIGFQACIPSGILSLNNLNGSVAPMRVRDRKYEHMLLQIVGLLCGIAGAIISYFSNFPTLLTVHSLCGFAANIVFILCGVTGLVVYNCYEGPLSPKSMNVFGRCIYFVHRLLGIVALLSSTACFICGIIKSPFKIWLILWSEEMFYILIIFCTLCSFIIVFKPLKELFNYFKDFLYIVFVLSIKMLCKLQESHKMISNFLFLYTYVNREPSNIRINPL